MAIQFAVYAKLQIYELSVVMVLSKESGSNQHLSESGITGSTTYSVPISQTVRKHIFL